MPRKAGIPDSWGEPPSRVDTCPWHRGFPLSGIRSPQRTFKYVATIQSLTDETCQQQKSRHRVTDPCSIPSENALMLRAQMGQFLILLDELTGQCLPWADEAAGSGPT
jgi:hypothetical protein